MRLLMITQDFPPETGGIQTYSVSHAGNLSKRCEWFGVVCPDKRAAAAVDAALPYPVYRLKSRNAHLLFHLFRRLPNLLEVHPADAVFHTQWQTVAASIRAKKAGLVDRIFVAAHIRELLFNPYGSIPGLNRIYEQYREWVLQNVDHFYPVSDYTAARLVQAGVEKKRITVIINGADPGRFRPGDRKKVKVRLGLEKKKVILTITRLVGRKGIDIVLKALEKIRHGIPDCHYLIVGDGEDRKRLEGLAGKAGLEEHVTFTGNVPYEELNDYYNAGDIFVMPSRTRIPDVEGFGIVFLEANACGLPVIGSDSGGIPSAILNGETGYIVPEGDADALAERITALFGNPRLMKTMGENGRNRVLEEANWEAVTGRLFEDMTVRMAEISP